jgi:hypothetical protein
MVLPSGPKVRWSVVSVCADRAQRCDEHHSLASGEAAQDAELGNARLAGARRQRHNEVVGLVDGAGGGLGLRRPQVDFRLRSTLQQRDA